jgi:nicotinamidase-related amidase
MVLLVIDTQNALTNSQLFNFDGFVTSVEKIIRAARKNGVEVVYVRHDDGPGSELARGTWGHGIYNRFAPREGEKIIDKQFNSAFKETGLLEYLRQKGEKDLIVVGLQTDYCIDATIKSGFEHGFRIFVPAGANTTVDNAFLPAVRTCEYYNDFMWQGRYAACIPMEEILENMRIKASAHE